MRALDQHRQLARLSDHAIPGMRPGIAERTGTHAGVAVAAAVVRVDEVAVGIQEPGEAIVAAAVLGGAMRDLHDALRLPGNVLPGAAEDARTVKGGKIETFRAGVHRQASPEAALSNTLRECPTQQLPLLLASDRRFGLEVASHEVRDTALDHGQ